MYRHSTTISQRSSNERRRIQSTMTAAIHTVTTGATTKKRTSGPKRTESRMMTGENSSRVIERNAAAETTAAVEATLRAIAAGTEPRQVRTAGSASFKKA